MMDDTRNELTNTSANESDNDLTMDDTIENKIKSLMNQLLSSNFDSDSKDCLLTLIKIIDNLLKKPNDSKVRNLKLSNAVIQRKIVSVKGVDGIEFLRYIGFTNSNTLSNNDTFDFGRAGHAPSTATVELVLLPENENWDKILSFRKHIVLILTHDLRLSSDEVPVLNIDTNFKRPPAVNNNDTSLGDFNVFQSRHYDTQALAANGRSDTAEVGKQLSKGKTLTEQKLDTLKQKQRKLQNQIEKLEDRHIIACLPSTSVPTPQTSTTMTNTKEGGGDSSLIASYFHKRQNEIQQRENEGLTTKAMREIKTLSKQKVYSHVQLRIYFMDGTFLTASFLPRESINVVKKVIVSTFNQDFLSFLGDSSNFGFDLYITPPKQILDPKKSLSDLGLVPAAKVHMSFHSPIPSLYTSTPGSFIQSQYFQLPNNTVDSNLTCETSSSANNNNAVSVKFPESQKIVDEEDNTKTSGMNKNNEKGNNKTKKSGTLSKEEKLMKLMMGRK